MNTAVNTQSQCQAVQPIFYVMKTNDGQGEQILAVDLIVGRSEGQR